VLDQIEMPRILRELIHAATVLEACGCLPATDGNFSARLDAQRVLLTLSGVEKRGITEDMFFETELSSENPGRGSSEWLLHRELYMNRPDIMCILHVHAPYLTTFAAAHRVPDVGLLSEGRLAIGGIALVPYCRPGTASLGREALRADATAGVYLLANHGAVSVGRTVREALHRLERAEFLARVEWHAVALGGGIPLSGAQQRELLGETDRAHSRD
jgi:L-fuculose-phosphate aldolase